MLIYNIKTYSRHIIIEALKFDNKLLHIDPVARLESFRALKLSRFESFRALKCSDPK